MSEGSLTWLRFKVEQSMALGSLLLVFSLLQAVTSTCPRSCQCFDKNGKFVRCTGKNLKEIPKDLPADTVTLHLNSNRITKIPSNAFKDLYLLKELDLSKNAIESIDIEAFKGIPEGLKMLDLSSNRIQSVPKEAFSKIKAKIRLSDNPWHCECSLQQIIEELTLDPETVNDFICHSSVQEEYAGQPLIQILDSGINFCNIHQKTTDVAMFITMFGWFTMVISYIVYYVRQNQEDARRHLEYLKSLPSTQITKEFDTISTVL
ncbi:leucine-rich repeat-containing protein 3 [Hemiscyllium ocellatum]|uniref:leucine-rich repeat-containing protein 3 n=1 Tax=Hemiscyllium ocellatum TaxID=170820 RepID=UPI0029668328|nr:leucine-rich repeat-containing protein 3 [Hemiscyllium ocellatum]